MRLSVLIPSYNQADFLAQTLATVYKQDTPPFEVIIMDGGSTDHTREVVDAFGGFVTHFTSESDAGQLDAVQKAIRVATGDVLYWLNSDDAVMPGAFTTVAQIMNGDPSVDVVFSDDWAFSSEMRTLHVGATISNLNFWDHFLYYRQMYSECIFWRASISEQALPVDTTLRCATDYSFFLPLCYGRRTRWVPERLGAFREQPGQMSQRTMHLVAAERAKIKDRMRMKLGWTVEEFEARRRAHWASFAIRHRLFPKLDSGLRFVRRKLTGDAYRSRVRQHLFDVWLQPPPFVIERLAEQWKKT